MIYFIKDFNYYTELLNNSHNKLHIKNLESIKINDLYDFMENQVYKNFFFDFNYIYKIPIKYKNNNNINIYFNITNMTIVKTFYKINTKVTMESDYSNYFKELIEYFNNRDYKINIPVQIQNIVIKNFIIHISKKIKNINILKNFIWNIYNVFFYKDTQNLLQYLFILNEKMNFIDYYI